MKTYIGVKIVQAEPEQKSHGPAGEAGWELHDGLESLGYVPWSPAETFEAAYREISADERALCGVNVITPAPSNFMSRLIAEHNELEDKLAKLGFFIEESPAYQELPIKQRQLLEIQRVHMTQYLGALHERMILLAPPAARLDHDAGDRDEILETRVTGGGSDETPIPFRDSIFDDGRGA